MSSTEIVSVKVPFASERNGIVCRNTVNLFPADCFEINIKTTNPNSSKLIYIIKVNGLAVNKLCIKFTAYTRIKLC